MDLKIVKTKDRAHVHSISSRGLTWMWENMEVSSITVTITADTVDEFVAQVTKAGIVAEVV